jgi:hypothetical protein
MRAKCAATSEEATDIPKVEPVKAVLAADLEVPSTDAELISAGGCVVRDTSRRSDEDLMAANCDDKVPQEHARQDAPTLQACSPNCDTDDVVTDLDFCRDEDNCADDPDWTEAEADDEPEGVDYTDGAEDDGDLEGQDCSDGAEGFEEEGQHQEDDYDDFAEEEEEEPDLDWESDDYADAETSGPENSEHLGSVRRAHTMSIRRRLRQSGGNRVRGGMPVVKEDDEDSDLVDTEGDYFDDETAADLFNEDEEDVYTDVDELDRSDPNDQHESPRHQHVVYSSIALFPRS